MPEMQLYNEFKSLLDVSGQETPLQSFLEQHPDIIGHTFAHGLYAVLFPKFRLADEFIPDFVRIGQTSAPDCDVDLIEIEPAVLNEKLFNKKHESTGRLRIAEGQITQWQVWMERNREFFERRVLDRISSEHVWDDTPFFEATTRHNLTFMVCYRIIIGRRTNFDTWGNRYRTNVYRNSSGRVEIVTWDRLLDNARLLEN